MNGDASFEATLYRASMTAIAVITVTCFGILLRVLRPLHRNM